jgi:hypothetical protein
MASVYSRVLPAATQEKTRPRQAKNGRQQPATLHTPPTIIRSTLIPFIILHFAFRILHSAFCILHSAFCILHSAF